MYPVDPQQRAVADELIAELGPPQSYRQRNVDQVRVAHELAGLLDLDPVEALQLVADLYRQRYGEANRMVQH